MTLDCVAVLVTAVLFLATLVRSSFGFGEALVAVPMLALIVPVDVAAPVAALVSITVAGVILLQDRADVHAGSAARLVLWTLPGIPLGLWLLTTIAEPAVKALLGGVIVSFSTFMLATRRGPALADDRRAWLFGFGAGVLGGAYGMNGPPLVIYGTLRGWSARRFRATLQGYFLPASLVVMAGYALAGLWTPVVSRHYARSLPAVLVAVFLGRALNRRLDGPRFVLYVHGGLIVLGATLLAQALAQALR